MGKIIEIRELFNDTLNEITSNENTWISFLKTASWNFKYDFSDQILIYAQRPNAIACAEMQEWNRKVKRWVNKGANCIFVFSKSEKSKYPFRFVFDVSDTHNYDNTPYKLWNVEKKYEKKIIEALEIKFGDVGGDNSIVQAIFLTSNNIIADNIQDYISSIIKFKTGTTLENLSDYEISGLIYEIAFNSVSFMLLNRCKINAGEYISEKDFSNIKKFKNNNNLTILLGTAISDIAEIGLREIAKTVANLDKEKNKNYTFVENKKQEYNKENNEGGFENEENRIYRNEKIQYSKHSNGDREDTKWKVRPNEITLFKESKERGIFDISDEQEIGRGINGNSNQSNRNGKSDREKVSEIGWDNRGNEKRKSDAMGKNDEQLQDNSRRTGNEGANLQLSLEEFLKRNQDVVKELLNEEEQKKIIAGDEKSSALIFPKEKSNNEILKYRTHKKRGNKIEYFELHPEIPMSERNNYKIQDNNLGVGSKKEKYKNNVEAIKILKQCDEQNRYATREEQEILSRYVGWGGIPDVFDSRNDNWSREYNELKTLLSEKEYNEAKRSTLTSFYTPPLVIKAMYKALENMGLKMGNILEPSCRHR